MAQKTLTIRGKRFTGKAIAAAMREDNMTKGGDYIINMDGDTWYASFRQVQDQPFAPVCSRKDATHIALTSGHEYSPSVWLEL